MSLERILLGIFGNKCPRCDEGKVFSGLIRMNATCPSCGFKYERESGYFVGAMAISYTIGFFATLPVFLYLLFGEYSLLQVVLIPSIELVLISPFVFRFSRLLWLYMDNRVDASS